MIQVENTVLTLGVIDVQFAKQSPYAKQKNKERGQGKLGVFNSSYRKPKNRPDSLLEIITQKYS